ncbi:MAG: T9SS type A sorting domain-containing protein [Ignavibacteriaceae bacterium]|nr:T9SS type A sorting domain-containing protein [Ignavibacteriaceae bacterium]
MKIINKVLFTCSLLAIQIAYSQSDTTAPQTPQRVKAFGYEKHIEVEWDSNTEPDLAGYKLYARSGQNFNLYTTISRTRSYFSLSMNLLGVGFYFKVSAFDSSGNESPLSDSTYAVTHLMTDEEFLDMVQRSTFRYFWDWGDPTSGIARERWHPNESDKTNTIGGGGFGVMAILVGIERGFITREQGAQRMLKITDFLANKIERFHGAFPHWFNGTTGKVVNFGIQNGGDIVESAFMIQGLLAVRQYFDGQDSTEEQIRNLITQIWHDVDWNFYRNNSSSGLYWNWSPTMGFNFSDTFIFHGWNETMIAYILAVASPTHPVTVAPLTFYRNGWANFSQIDQLRNIFGYLLYVGSSYGGPLFFTHYSFLGFDPRHKKDEFANYFTHNRNQSLVQRAYCISNPKKFNGYGENSWGLTASYSIPDVGYLAHEPNNDNGTISPTAALSAMPYTPNESIAALKHFYRTHGSSLWGDFGFRDAFNLTYSKKGVLGTWFSDGYLAIDQGPIIVMIENYRSQLLWNKFMSNPEIQTALTAVGFVPDSTTDVEENKSVHYSFKLAGNYPNPFNPTTAIRFELEANAKVSVKIYDALGQLVRDLLTADLNRGVNEVIWDGKNEYGSVLPSGIYLYRIEAEGNYLSGKMILQK